MQAIQATHREIEVLEKMSQGLTSKEIANSLYLSTHTVISHKKNLQVKFNASNAIDLVVKAIKMDLIKV